MVLVEHAVFEEAAVHSRLTEPISAVIENSEVEEAIVLDQLKEVVYF